MDAAWRRAWRSAWPWMAVVVGLYASQVWAVFDSAFTMPVTLLQVPFVLAFLGFILFIAHAQVSERGPS